MDWYAFSVHVASDGVHMVRDGPWATSFDNEAVSFFANGKLLRTYTIAELVDLRFAMAYSVSHFHWSRDRRLDNVALVYTVRTYDLNSYEFDLTTGEIKSALHPARWLGAILIVGGAVLAIILYRRWRSRLRPT